MTTPYNLKNIRALLTEGFTPADLRTFCYDYPAFRPVYDQLSESTGKAEIVHRLVEHAERQELFELLFAWAEKQSPAKYKKYQPYHAAPIIPQQQRVQIYLQGDFSDLSDERRSTAINAFAALLGISSQEIEVYRVYLGSIVFDLGIPLDAVQRLRSLLQSNDAQLHLLGVEKIILEIEFSKTEEWIITGGKFVLVTSGHPEEKPHPDTVDGVWDWGPTRAGASGDVQIDDVSEELSLSQKAEGNYIAQASHGGTAIVNVPSTTGPLPELTLRLFKMDRAQTYQDELEFEQREFPSEIAPNRFSFGFILENQTESTIAQQIDIRIEISWRGQIQLKPKFYVPHSWEAYTDELVCEKEVVLTFGGAENVRIPFGQPKEWRNFSLELKEKVDGYFLIRYKVSSAQPKTMAEGELKIRMIDPLNWR